MIDIEIEEENDGRELFSKSDVVLVAPRDREVWAKQDGIKEAKQKLLTVSQHSTNYLLERYLKSQKYLRANIHLTIGKQRL